MFVRILIAFCYIQTTIDTFRQQSMSKRKSRDEVEPSREFPNPFAQYSGGQLVDATGKV